jgi:hypothetical protein
VDEVDEVAAEAAAQVVAAWRRTGSLIALKLA